MKFKSRVENKSMTIETIVFELTPKERDILVKCLRSIVKRVKLDRLDEFVMADFMELLENPQKSCLPPPAVKVTPKDTKQDSPAVDRPSDEIVDKKQIVERVKSRVDPRNEKDLATFVKESIEFAQKNIGIKTVPKDASVEAFYDFLVESKIINSDGSPFVR